MKKGRVYLVGAGPGEPGLLTLRAAELIKKADVIIYDRLANEEILTLAGKECQCIYVGKMPGRHILKQEEINKLLILHAEMEKRVVRLKGGDPLIFGRGAEEAAALYAAGIPFEIVPGISSFYAACTYGGIPVTFRNAASSFHVFTGHFQGEGEINYEVAAKLSGTLIFLMGVKNLRKIANGLLKAGKNGDTPASIIEWGTTCRQRQIVSTLKNLPEEAEKQKLGHPSVIVVGEVVNWKKQVDWLPQVPLWGKRVLLTREQGKSAALVEGLCDAGISVTEKAMIQIEPLENFEELDKKIKEVENYQWILFTSRHGAEAFFRRLMELGLDARSLFSTKIACVGEATFQTLKSRGVLADCMPKNYSSVDLAEELGKQAYAGDKVLYPASSLSDTFLTEELEKKQIKCDKVTAYFNRARKDRKKEELLGYDAVVFFSASQVKNYFAVTEGEAGGTKLCAVGKKTAEALQKEGRQAYAIAENTTAGALQKMVLHVLAMTSDCNAL